MKEERKKGLWLNYSGTQQTCRVEAGVQGQALAPAGNAAQCLQWQTQLRGEKRKKMSRNFEKLIRKPPETGMCIPHSRESHLGSFTLEAFTVRLKVEYKIY